MTELVSAEDFDLEKLEMNDLRRLYNRGCHTQAQLEQWLDSVLEEILRRGG